MTFLLSGVTCLFLPSLTCFKDFSPIGPQPSCRQAPGTMSRQSFPFRPSDTLITPTDQYEAARQNTTPIFLYPILEFGMKQPDHYNQPDHRLQLFQGFSSLKMNAVYIPFPRVHRPRPTRPCQPCLGKVNTSRMVLLITAWKTALSQTATTSSSSPRKPCL